MAKILIVDDSDTFRAQLKRDLNELGHDIIEAEDGRKGEEVFRKNSDVALIFCDINMPELDGLGMIGLLKDAKLLENTIIFMLTTETGKELKEKGKALGVRAWITKPYNKDKVLAAVEKVLEKK